MAATRLFTNTTISEANLASTIYLQQESVAKPDGRAHISQRSSRSEISGHRAICKSEGHRKADPLGRPDLCDGKEAQAAADG